MSEMKVAVIDNGVDSRLVDCCQEVDLSEKHWTEASEKEKYGHGTVCAAIIKKYAPESEIVSLKVVDESAKRCNWIRVQNALLYCINQDIRLISMSMGTRDFVETALLYDSIAKVIKAGIILAAPGSRNLRVYPAAFPGVIYVDINDRITGRNSRYYTEKCNNGLLAYIASGTQEITFKSGETFITPNYSSFSVPVMVAVLYRIMKYETNIGRVNELLRSGSAGYIYPSNDVPSSQC